MIAKISYPSLISLPPVMVPLTMPHINSYEVLQNITPYEGDKTPLIYINFNTDNTVSCEVTQAFKALLKECASRYPKTEHVITAEDVRKLYRTTGQISWLSNLYDLAMKLSYCITNDADNRNSEMRAEHIQIMAERNQ